MHDKIQRYSLRKLSVGLASVMVGACIFSVNGKTVKADVTSDQTTQTTNVQGQTATTQPQNEKKQTSSAQNSVANQSQKNLLDDLGKQKTSTQSGDQAEVQENRLVDKINSKLTSDNNTDHKEDLGQNKVAPDETKSNPTTKSDAEKSIVSPSSAQKINNQSNDHADDNSQTQNEQKLDITKNSKKFAKKVLATNLTQDNANASQKSKVETQKQYAWDDTSDEAMIARGFHKTVVGWTTFQEGTDYDAVAKNSKLHIDSNPITLTNQHDYFNYLPANLKTTIDKKDLAKNKRILLASMPVLDNNTDTKYPTNISNTLSLDQQWANGVNIYDATNNTVLGHIVGYHHNNCFELIFYVDNDDTYSNDLSFEYQFSSSIRSGMRPNTLPRATQDRKYQEKVILPDNSAFQVNYYVNPVETQFINYSKSTDTPHLTSIDLHWNAINFTHPSTDFDRVIHVTPNLKGVNDFKPTWIATVGYFDLFNKDGKVLKNEQLSTSQNNASGGFINKGDNLTATQLFKATPDGQCTYSRQSDGSYLLSFKLKNNEIDNGHHKATKEDLTALIKNTNWWNFSNASDTEKQDVLNSTIAHYENNDFAPEGHWDIIYFSKNENKPFSLTVDDVTPNEKPIFNRSTAQHIPDGLKSIDMSMYRTYHVHYVDELTNQVIKNEDISLVQTGTRASYTLNLPDGTILVPNSKIYVDGKIITLNSNNQFNFDIPKDEKKNPDPIVIHLNHKYSTVTDPSQLQTTGKRTITIKMPKGHGDQMTIVQTVGYKRTGTLDLYTGKATYTDWVFDADTSNVTVNGQVSTQYQAYVLKDGVVNYAPIKLPHINGYKAKLIKDKANPAMFMVSFVALPQQNNQSNNTQSSQKPAQPEQKQPEPIQNIPAPVESDKEVAQILNHIAFELMHNSSSNADSFEPAQNDSAPLEAPSDSTQKDDAAKPQKVNAAKHKKHIVKKHVVKRHKKHAKKYHLKRRSRKHTKRAKKCIMKRRRTSKKFKKYSLKKHIKRV